MATRYVSQTATNVYAIGVDTNDGLTKAAPKLTLESALTASAAGDTIIINDGVYTPTTLYTVANGVTIQPENAMAVELRGVAGQAAVVNVTHSGAGTTTIGALFVNANAAAVAAVSRADVATDVRLYLTGTKLGQGTTSAVTDLCKRGITGLTNISIVGSGGTHGYNGSISFGQAANKTLTIDGIDFDVTTGDVTYYGVNCARYSAGAPVGTVAVSVKNLTGEIKPAATGYTTNTYYGVLLTGIDAPLVEDCDIKISSESTTASSIGIQIRATSANATSPGGIIRRNKVDFNCPAGYAILIGDNANVDYSGGSVAYENEVTGRYYAVSTPHGISLGRVTGGKVYNNKVYDFYVGIIASINQAGLIFNNITDGCYGVDLYSKGCGATTPPIFANNTLIKRNRVGDMRVELGALGVNAQGATANVDTLFTNNRVVGFDMAPRMTFVGADQNATFERNGYPESADLAADSFKWQGTSQDFAAWQTAHEADAAQEFARTAVTTDGKLSAGSRLCHSAKAVTGVTDSGEEDPFGNEFATYPNIGADQGAAKGFGPWSPFDSTMPTLALSPTAPGKLRSVQAWTRAHVTKQDIEKVAK